MVRIEMCRIGIYKTPQRQVRALLGGLFDVSSTFQVLVDRSATDAEHLS